MKYITKRFYVIGGTILTAMISLHFSGSHDHVKKRAAVEQTDSSKGLKDYYRNYFPIGVAVNVAALSGPTADLVTREFNSVTAENDMKISVIHPREDQYNWKNADAIVDFAVSHHIKIRGHNLLWHTQVPNWMFRDSAGALVSKDVLLKRLKDHITTVVKRYKGKIYAWDVVNEAIDDDPNKYLRNSLWYQICGEDFLAKAFEYAHEADPKAALYYNDYNSESPSKREKIYKLLKNLKDAKVPIDGVGLQGHWKLTDPSPALIREAIDRYASLGLKIQITELDVTIRGPRTRPDPNAPAPVDSGYTERIANLQADRYREIFQIFREYKNVITNVTFWNVSDRYSWLDARNGGLAGGAAASINTPRVVRKAYPLLFDQDLKRKKAYWSVVKF